jgi:hypothetical protein
MRTPATTTLSSMRTVATLRSAAAAAVAAAAAAAASGMEECQFFQLVRKYLNKWIKYCKIVMKLGVVRRIHDDVVVARHNDFVFVGLLLHPGAKRVQLGHGSKIGKVAAVNQDVAVGKFEVIVHAVRVRYDDDASVRRLLRRRGGQSRAEGEQMPANLTPTARGRGVMRRNGGRRANDTVSEPGAAEAGADDFDEEKREEDDGNEGVEVAVAQTEAANKSYIPDKRRDEGGKGGWGGGRGEGGGRFSEV